MFVDPRGVVLARHAAAVPQLGGAPLRTFLLQLAVLLLLAHLLGRLSRRCGLPAVVGELLSGLILGPSLLGSLTPSLVDWLLPTKPEQAHLLDGVAQLGVVLLVGVTGAQLDLDVLRQRRAVAVRVSLYGLFLPLALGFGAGLLLPRVVQVPHQNRFSVAAFLGVALCVSALPVIAKSLSDMGILHRDLGQLILSCATVDDAVGWLFLSVLSALVGVSFSTYAVIKAVLAPVALVLAAAVVGRPVVRLVMRRADEARAEPAGPGVAAVVLLLLGAGLSSALGMEPVFGAFVAGSLIGLPGVVAPVRLAPLRAVTMSIFAPIFLADAGLRMDLTTLLHPVTAVTAVVLCVLAISGKLVGAYLGARSGGLTHREGIALGSGLNARGVIEVVVATVGLRLGLLTPALYTVIVLVAVVTSIMAPPMLRWSMRGSVPGPAELTRGRRMEGWSAAGGRGRPAGETP